MWNLTEVLRRITIFCLPGTVILLGACSSASISSSQGREMSRTEQAHVSSLDASCRLGPVGGDTRGVATGPRSLLLIGEGIGLIRSEDGIHFDKIEMREAVHWPSISFGRGRAVISWIRLGEGDSTAVVAKVGRKVHPAVAVFSSGQHLIDTEILIRATGEILLMVSEVEGPPNRNRASYRLHCFASEDGGRNWEERARAVSGPWGINIEDPRLIELDSGRILLAYEWEMEEGGASRILIQHSDDGGWSWSAPEVLLDGKEADREPGGFTRRKTLLYFVASTDKGNHRSYAGARLVILSSSDGGQSWSRPLRPIGEVDQLTMGAISLEDRILLPSLRFYTSRRPILYLYAIDPLGLWRLPCGPGLRYESR